MSTVPTCCVTGRIAGDTLACGDCDPCILGAPSVPDAVKRLIAERDEWADKYAGAMMELDEARAAAALTQQLEAPRIEEIERLSTDTTINPDTSDWTDRERAYYAHGWNDATRSTAAEIERLRAALEEIIQHAQLGSRPWVVIPDHLIEKAKAAIQQIADKDTP